MRHQDFEKMDTVGWGGATEDQRRAQPGCLLSDSGAELQVHEVGGQHMDQGLNEVTEVGAHLCRNATGNLECTDHVLKGRCVHLDLLGSFKAFDLHVDLLNLCLAVVVLLLKFRLVCVNNSEVEVLVHVGDQRLNQWSQVVFELDL